MPALFVTISVLSMLACYAIAKSRSANHIYWAAMGLCFGPLAIPFAFFAKPKGG